MKHRWVSAAALSGFGLLAGCQLLSGLNGLHVGTGGAGGGDPTSSTISAGGAATTSSSSPSMSSSSGGCSADMKTDKANCGACDHDCAGGTCTDGVCQPYKLVEAMSSPITSLVSDGVYVYWGWDNGGSGSIERYRIDGTENKLVVAARPSNLVTEGNNLYWYDLGADAIMTISSTNMTAVEVFPIANPIGQIHLVTGMLFWNTPATNQLFSGIVMGGMATPIDAVMKPARFAVDGSNVYWSNGSVLYKQPIPLISSDVPTSLTDVANVGNVAVNADADDGYVYYTVSSAGGSVNRRKTDGTGTASEAMLATASFTDALLVDKAFVYWTNYAAAACTGSGKLGALRLDDPSATPFPLASVSNCGPVAQDDKALYFAEGAQIYRVVKPSP